MQLGVKRLARLSLVVAVAVLAPALSRAQSAAAARGWDAPGRVGMPRDWSGRHVLYTNGGSPQQQAAAQSDPRAWQNWVLRTFHPGAAGSAVAVTPSAPPAPPAPRPSRLFNPSSHVDWAVSLGPNGGMAAGQSPAKYVFDVTQPPSCQNDFVVFTINATPLAGRQANLVAFNNLYRGSVPATGLCGAGAASFLWSYAAGTGPVALSPSLSLDGKKVVFVEAANTGRALLHVLTWVAGQGTDATTGAVAPGTGGSSDVTVDFTNLTTAGCAPSGASDTNAAPYIDYAHDAAFVADDNGRLYRIKNVFLGTPALDFCVSVSPGNMLSSPVYDSGSNKVVVSDGQSVFAYSVGAAGFTAAGSITVAANPNSIVQSPVLDSTNGFVYVFSSSDTSNTNAIVSQMPLSLATHTDVPIGPGNGSFAILDGAFDNAYYDLGPSGGTLYACGTQPAHDSKPALYSISFQANGTINTTPVMNGNPKINGGINPNGGCSPLTEFYDGANDRLFLGTGIPSNAGGANRVTMWNINARLTSTATNPSATAGNEIGGASGITVDNVSPQPQASSIYFGTLGVSGGSPCGTNLYCAVKLTQGALQ